MKRRVARTTDEDLPVPPLTDPERLRAYRDALSNWNVTDYVQFRLTSQSYRWVTSVLGVTLEEIARLMHEHVESGGQLDEVPETREHWRDEHEFHYDILLTINGTHVYIESRLFHQVPVEPDESWVLVVSIHEP